MPVVRLIPEYFFKDFIHSCRIATFLHATVQADPGIAVMIPSASSATHTAGSAVQHLGGRGLRFRIVTPDAMQRTAFEEDGRPDSRSVVRAEMLYVE